MSSDAITEINALSDDAFVARFGFLFEHSPWVVKTVTQFRPFEDIDDMMLKMIVAFEDAGQESWLEVFRAHPRLADKATMAIGLTRESASEQSSAGLDALSEAEFKRFHQFNAAYEEKFGFPFIVCVRLAGGKSGILGQMEERLGNAPETEIAYALEEVTKIVRLRLIDEVTK